MFQYMCCLLNILSVPAYVGLFWICDPTHTYDLLNCYHLPAEQPNFIQQLVDILLLVFGHLPEIHCHYPGELLKHPFDVFRFGVAELELEPLHFSEHCLMYVFVKQLHPGVNLELGLWEREESNSRIILQKIFECQNCSRRHFKANCLQIYICAKCKLHLTIEGKLMVRIESPQTFTTISPILEGDKFRNRRSDKQFQTKIQILLHIECIGINKKSTFVMSVQIYLQYCIIHTFMVIIISTFVCITILLMLLDHQEMSPKYTRNEPVNLMCRVCNLVSELFVWTLFQDSNRS